MPSGGLQMKSSLPKQPQEVEIPRQMTDAIPRMNTTIIDGDDEARAAREEAEDEAQTADQLGPGDHEREVDDEVSGSVELEALDRERENSSGSSSLRYPPKTKRPPSSEAEDDLDDVLRPRLAEARVEDADARRQRARSRTDDQFLLDRVSRFLP